MSAKIVRQCMEAIYSSSLPEVSTLALPGASGSSPARVFCASLCSSSTYALLPSRSCDSWYLRQWLHQQ